MVESHIHHLRRRYSPPKTVEQARKLVESDQVLMIFQALAQRATPRLRNT